MTLQQMTDFIAVVQHGSLHAAARATGQAQSSLSKSLRRLEESTGAPLFVRHARGVQLTESGSCFLAHARPAVAEARRAREAVAQLRDQRHGQVSYGISTAPSLLLAPAAVTRFRQRFPQVALRSHAGLHHTLAPLLREGIIDFAICPVPGEDAAGEFAVKDLLPSAMAMVARAGHPLAGARRLRQLKGQRFVVGGPRGLPGAGIFDVFDAAGLGTPAVELQTDTPLDTLAMVASSDCLGLVPAALLGHGFFRGAVVPLPIQEPLPVYRVGLFQRHGVPLTPAAQALAGQFEQEAARAA
jgi:LysR family transcriptional regulator, regulator of abg operon